MSVTVLLPDDKPAFTGLSDVAVSVHITSTNVYAPDKDFVRPHIGRNVVIAASTGIRKLEDFKKTLFPTASRVNSAEFELLATSLKPNQIVVEFETSDIPTQPWRYQIYSRATGGSHAHVTEVLPFCGSRLALLTYDGTLRKNTGYRIFVLFPLRNYGSSDLYINETREGFPVHRAVDSNQRPMFNTERLNVKSTVSVNSVPTSTFTSRLYKASYPTVVRLGSESWYAFNVENRNVRTGILYEDPFVSNTTDRLFDDTSLPPEQYGSRYKTSGRSADRGSTTKRESLVLAQVATNGKTVYKVAAGARAEPPEEVAARGGSEPKLIDINKPDPYSSASYMMGSDPFNDDGTSHISGVEIVVEGVDETTVCGGESLDKLLPAILRSFGDNLAITRGEPVTRTLTPIYKSAQKKTPVGFLLGKIRVETTLAFPKDLAFGPYKVWINGHECEYSEATSGCDAYLVDVVAKDFIRTNIPSDAEVILDVPSLPPEIIGLG